MTFPLYYLGALNSQTEKIGVPSEIEVTPEPIANAAASTTTEGTFIDLNVLENDTHTTGETLTVIAASVDPGQGTVSINVDNTVRFTPASGFLGDATISYTIEDENSRTDSSYHIVTVTEVFPVAVGDTGTTSESASIILDVLANDTHALSETLTIASASVSPAEGTVVVNVDDTITFTPADGFTGDATITYVVEDEGGSQDTGTAIVTVTAVYPTAVADTATTPENTSVLIDVLANDTHPLSDTLTLVSASCPPVQGTVAIVSGQVEYYPATNFNGTANLSYVVADENGDQDTGSITVTVTPDEVPVANPDTATTQETTTVDIDVLANDTHSIDALTVVAASLTVGTGTVSIVGNMVRYTPGTGFTGEATISYTIEDANGDQDSSTVTVTVEADPAPTAVDDTGSGDEDTTINIAVLTNDTHPTDSLTVVAASVLTGSGTVAIVSNILEFTPTANWNGVATLSYTVEDSNGDQDTATVTVTVNPVDDDPVAVDDTGTMPEQTTQSFDVLANDTHPDGDSLTIVSVSVSGAEGTATIVSNEVSFTPLVGFTGDATITYTVEDANGDQDTGTLVVTVLAVYPVAVDDTATTPEDTAVLIDVLANDTHANSDDLTVVSASVNVLHGSTTITSNMVQFTPASGFSGSTTITYVVEDETGDQDTGEVTVTVAPSFDVFDSPTSYYMSRWVAGSVSGTAKTNCNLYSKRTGYDGTAQQSVEWVPSGSTRAICELLNYDDPTQGSINYFRCKAKVVTSPAGKLYIHFNCLNVNPLWWIIFDITDDGTAASSRVHSYSSEIVQAGADEHPSYDGWIFMKWTVDLTTAADTDGAVKCHLTDDPTGDGLLDLGTTRSVYLQDFTWALD